MGTGNTACRLCHNDKLTVHPRGHGEHRCIGLANVKLRGSSPWARGTRHFRTFASFTTRFIPVGTGNTKSSTYQFKTTPVHPRGHGEHSRKGFDRYVKGGSSPWARGTRNTHRRKSLRSRFIPVGTGNTIVHQPMNGSITVHPRGHGEHNHFR